MARRRVGRHGVFDDSDPLLDGPVAETVDLHMWTADKVRTQLGVALMQAQRRNPSGSVVHIITGKGKGSVNGAVLKPLVRQLLDNELACFIDDKAEDVSGGGYMVRLK